MRDYNHWATPSACSTGCSLSQATASPELYTPYATARPPDDSPSFGLWRWCSRRRATLASDGQSANSGTWVSFPPRAKSAPVSGAAPWQPYPAALPWRSLRSAAEAADPKNETLTELHGVGKMDVSACMSCFVGARTSGKTGRRRALRGAGATLHTL